MLEDLMRVKKRCETRGQGESGTALPLRKTMITPSQRSNSYDGHYESDRIEKRWR